MPIYREESERAAVLEYSEKLKQELAAQVFEGRTIDVILDDRDLRGGEKKWQHIKKGVPLIAEVGPRDIANDSVFLTRRDTGEKTAVKREELVGSIAGRLQGMQDDMYQRALTFRQENTVSINSLDEFKDYFTAKSKKKPEIHGGFAECDFIDGCPEMDALLKELKVTVRCIPLDAEPVAGTCLFSGKPTKTRGVFAKAY
jgi:prolyl-tRNA synthetase